MLWSPPPPSIFTSLTLPNTLHRTLLPLPPQIKLVLQKLAGVNSTPMIALNEAAELLCKHLSVNYCR